MFEFCSGKRLAGGTCFYKLERSTPNEALALAVFFHHGCFFVHDSLELCVCLEFIPGRPPMCPLHFQTSLVATKMCHCLASNGHVGVLLVNPYQTVSRISSPHWPSFHRKPSKNNFFAHVGTRRSSPRFEIDHTSTLHCAKVTTATSLPYMERYLAKSNPLKSGHFMYVSTGRGAFDSASFWSNYFVAACKDPKPPHPLTTMVLARPDMFGTGPCCMRLVCFKESVWD